jgi:uncharacterized protein DUF6338
MIPETAGALLAFLGLIAPGLLFTLRRERRQPGEKETAFREAAHVALTSLAFTVVSLAVLVPLSMTGAWLPDVGAWLATPSPYVASHYLAVTVFLALHVVISCGLALVVEELTGRDATPTMKTWGVWYHVLNRNVPPGTARIWLWVTTEDGTQFKGPLRSYTAEEADRRDLALGGAPITSLAPDADQATGWVTLAPFDAVIIDGTRIRHLAVQYLGEQGQSLQAVKPPTPRSWLPRRHRSG